MDINLPEVSEQLLKLARETAEQLDGATLYENSVQEQDGLICFMIRRGLDRFLIVLQSEAAATAGFKGEKVDVGDNGCLLCPLTHENAEVVRSLFDYTRPVLIGTDNSYGFCHRPGNAGAAHLNALGSIGCRPRSAQRSIRPYARTRQQGSEALYGATCAAL